MSSKRGYQINFDGRVVTVLDGKGEYLASFPATTGLPGTSVMHQPLKDKGPVPEGKWFIDPTQFSEAGVFRGIANALPKWLGGTDWGTWRVPIEPDNGTVTYVRDGFFFHGGERPGSAGCIDLGKYDNAFRELLRGHVGIIPVNISYPIPISEAPPPEEQAQALDDAQYPTCQAPSDQSTDDGASLGTSDQSTDDGASSGTSDQSTDDGASLGTSDQSTDDGASLGTSDQSTDDGASLGTSDQSTDDGASLGTSDQSTDDGATSGTSDQSTDDGATSGTSDQSTDDGDRGGQQSYLDDGDSSEDTDICTQEPVEPEPVQVEPIQVEPVQVEPVEVEVTNG